MKWLEREEEEEKKRNFFLDVDGPPVWWRWKEKPDDLWTDGGCSKEARDKVHWRE